MSMFVGMVITNKLELVHSDEVEYDTPQRAIEALVGSPVPEAEIMPEFGTRRTRHGFSIGGATNVWSYQRSGALYVVVQR